MTRSLLGFSVVVAALAFLAIPRSAGAQSAGGGSAPPGITARGLHELIEKSRGKVLVLNFWATWCPPCVREFPALVKLHQGYKSRGLEVVGISMNDVSEMADVQAFLHKHKPPFPLYIAGSVDDAFYRSIDKRWSTELPLTLIYDSTGKLRHFHNDERTYAQFEKDVQSLLERGSKKSGLP